MFEGLKENIEHAKKIILNMRAVEKNTQEDIENKNLYESSLKSLADQLIILNKAVPDLLGERQVRKISEVVPVKKDVSVRVSYVSPKTKEKSSVNISSKDKKVLLEKLKLEHDAFKKVDKIKKEEGESVDDKFLKSYAGFSNKFFRKYSEKMSPGFSDLNKDLKKGNISVLLTSYLSMAMMSMLIAFILGFGIFGFMMFIDLNNWIYFITPFGLAGLVLTVFYLYPSGEASTADKNISYELPFATIHMAAIAGSNISPSEIFRIVISSGGYPSFASEIRKVLVQVDVYGYDLVTSLKNVASRTSNKKLAELFSGLAANISGGGALKSYLSKKSENFLVDYRLERQKYTALAGTFMDVYISLLIAAPLVLMMMFIVMNVSGMSMGALSIEFLMILAVFLIIVLNIVFLVVLNMKQPKV